MSTPVFNADCQKCPRLATFLNDVRREYPNYYARPVPPFGDPRARLLIVGLAPGMHGANASGRPFTGDHAGIILYDTLFRFGFSNQPQASSRDDGLQLQDCRITNAVKCLPPENKPTTEEVKTCNSYLRAELTDCSAPSVILALGNIAHGAVLRALDRPSSSFRFSHGARHDVGGGQWLIDSYHCSRYNTQTRRLTEPMFHQVFQQIRDLLHDHV